MSELDEQAYNISYHACRVGFPFHFIQFICTSTSSNYHIITRIRHTSRLIVLIQRIHVDLSTFHLIQISTSSLLISPNVRQLSPSSYWYPFPWKKATASVTPSARPPTLHCLVTQDQAPRFRGQCPVREAPPGTPPRGGWKSPRTWPTWLSDLASAHQ